MKETQRPLILIVDDTISNIRILVNVLKTEYEIVSALDASEAIQIAREIKPDLILLDVLMPDINGYEACSLLKSDDITRSIPVIFITSKSGDEGESMGFQVGGVDYITKPINPVITKARIRTHIELKRNRDLLAELSFHDSLTGIANRRRFNEYLDWSWDMAMRESQPISLLMIDIDHFKQFNDHYGHPEGDNCLRVVALALASAFHRKTDLLCRFGGEEFVCILLNTEIEGAMKVAESLRMKIIDLRIPHLFSPVSECITVSIGATSIVPFPGICLSVLLDKADKALYKAKENGRNMVCCEC